MGGTLKSRRFAPAIGGALVLGLAAFAFGAPGSAPGVSATTAAAPVKLELLSASQQQILSAGKLRARVSVRQPGTVVIRPRATTLAGQRSRLGKRRRVSFGKAGSKVVGMRLSVKGRALLADCGPKSIVLRGRLRSGGQASASAAARVVRGVSLDSAACATPGGSTGGGGGGGGNGNVIPPATPYTGPNFPTGDFARCDFMDTAICLQPWPNDFFTIVDNDTDTNRRVNLNANSMPANQPLGVPVPVTHISPTEHNKNDGFSPGNLIVTKVPGLDNPQAFENTGAVPIDDPGAYDDPNQPVVVINAATGERHPVWSEIDSNPADPGDSNLIIRPLVNFDEGGRYVVALRNLKNAANQTIEPAAAFKVYRDNLTTMQAPVEARRPHMEDLFETLGQAGIQRSSLYLAWDFTVASERNLSERVLTIRDDAFAQLNDTNLANGTVEGSSPAFTVDAPTDFAPCSAGVDASCEDGEDNRIGREVTGTVTVPCYMTPDCGPSNATYNYGPDGLPEQNGTVEFTFQCEIPRTSLDGPIATGTRPSLYGHGLLGSAGEVGGGNVKAMAFEHQFTMCATDWYGFATQNLSNILLILQDLSRFPTLVDPSQQGFLNFMYLGRAMIHTDGFIDDPAFQVAGNPVIDTDKLFYDGNSQGGILGGSLAAVAPDFERAVLGVPGMNYSTLLRRSVDFEPYAEGEFTPIICDEFPTSPVNLRSICQLLPEDTPLGLYDNYPNELERPLILSLMQMLWDRGEANGYAHHMTDDELPNTPEHQVLLHAAFGDHQVANVTAEVEARTIGASVYQPALDATDGDPQNVDPGADQRHWEADGSNPIFGIPAVTSFPFGGSALIYWDGGGLSAPGGTATPPDGNIPPRPDQGYGADPHSYPRNDVKGRAQKSDFLAIGGVLQNYCTTANRPDPAFGALVPNTGTPLPCYSHGFLGTP